MAPRRLRFRGPERAGPPRLHVPDGSALDHLRAGQVRLPSSGPERARTHGRKRHGGDGHLRGHPGRETWSAACWSDCPSRARGSPPSDASRVALLGRGMSHFIQKAPPLVPDLVVRWNPFGETLRNLKLAAENIVVFRGLMGVSWLWFFGASFLTQLPNFAKDVLGGSEGVASLLLVVFSVGIGIGSLLCESLSRRHVELGLVPIGAFGMTAFAVDLYFASRGFVHGPAALTARAVPAESRAHSASWRPGSALGLRRSLLRSALCTDPVAERAHPSRPHLRGQQHPGRPVHDRFGRSLRGPAQGWRLDPHDLPGRGAS